MYFWSRWRHKKILTYKKHYVFCKGEHWILKTDKKIKSQMYMHYNSWYLYSIYLTYIPCWPYMSSDQVYILYNVVGYFTYNIANDTGFCWSYLVFQIIKNIFWKLKEFTNFLCNSLAAGQKKMLRVPNFYLYLCTTIHCKVVTALKLTTYIKAAITMVLSQDVGLFPIIHGRKNLGNHSHVIH